MNCREALELSSLYLSRELDGARAAEMRNHLDSCSSCAGEMEQIREADLRLRDVLLDEQVDTSAIDARVRECIRPSRRWMAAAAGIAAALVVGLTVRMELRPDPTCVDAAVDHHDEVVNGVPRRWRTDAQEIAQLAAKQGVAVPQLEGAGYRLERGKLCRLTGHIYLHVIVSDAAGSEMSIFLAPGDSAAPVRVMDSGAEHVAYFETGRVKAIVVADQSSASAAGLARAAERAL